MKTRKAGVLGICAAMALVMAPAVPAHAVVTSASGSETCPTGQSVWVRVWTTTTSQVSFYSGITFRYKSSLSDIHIYNYGTRTVNWRVEAPGGIDTVTDYCSHNVSFTNG